MRFPERRALAALALTLAVGPALATPESTRSEIAARLRQQLPQLEPSAYALGSAAFDAELRAALAANASAAVPVIEAGKRLWQRKFRNGRSLAGCFPNGGRRIAASYPLYDPRLKRVITLEMAINQCLKSHGEPLLDPTDPRTMGAATAYVRSLSNGLRVAVRVPAAAAPRFEEGRRLYFTRMGQRNYACASCHVQGAGRWFGNAALSPAIGQATHWPLVRGGAPVTLQSRMRECLELMGAAPFPAGSEELNHLEYFLGYLSNGLTIRANAWRGE